MLKTDFWLYLIKFIFVSAGIYLAFRCLLPLLLPFLLAYLAVYLLSPVMNYADTRLHLPKGIARYGTLLLALVGALTILSVLFWKIVEQLRLLFSNAPAYAQFLSEVCHKHFHTICERLDHSLGLHIGTTTAFVSDHFASLSEKYHLLLSEKAGKTLLSCFHSSIRLFAFTGFFVAAMFILTKEIVPLRACVQRSRHYPAFHLIYRRMKESGFTYLKTELIILLLNWILCSFGIFLLHNPYFFLVGAFIAVLDALPIIGSGLFLIPWSIILILQADYLSAIILFLTFLSTLFTREILEARLLGKGMGINPFIMLLSIYVGIHLFGPAGIFLGPLGSVLLQTLMSEPPPPN